MDTTKPHGFFLASFLVLVFLRDLTEACSPCKERSLREACCKHDFVMKVHFLYVRRDPDFPIHMNMFRINVIEVYKGPEYMRTVGVLYSPESEYYCGYHHKSPFNGENYLISGSIDDIGFQIRKCHLAKPWSEVSAKDRVNLSTLGGRDCSTICEHL